VKYKLYIRQYNITTNDYEVREEIVETNDIYHEIGKIYSTAFTEIKRIDYEKIDETKELKAEIERLNKRIDKAIEYHDNCINNLLDLDKIDDNERLAYKVAYGIHDEYLNILKGSDKE